MDFKHSEERQLLADMLQRFVAEQYDTVVRHRIASQSPGHSPDLWRQLAELGAPGVLFSPEDGGYGGTGFDILVVFEALGRGAVVEPFLPTLMAGHAIAAAGGARDLLVKMIAGEAIAAFAHQEPDSRYELATVSTRAVRTAAGWSISGAKAVVQHAEAADVFVVSARTEGEILSRDGISLFCIPADTSRLDVRGYAGIDGARAGDLFLDAVDLPPGALVGVEGTAYGAIERACGLGTIAICAEALGLMEAIKDMTLDYLRTRRQFGVPIGSFQALQHRMSTVLVEIEQARSSVINAIGALEQFPVARERAISAAKYTIGRVGALVGEEAIQMHGGIGMTWELPLSHFAKRLIMVDHHLGDSDHHLERYIALGRVA